MEQSQPMVEAYPILSTEQKLAIRNAEVKAYTVRQQGEQQMRQAQESANKNNEAAVAELNKVLTETLNSFGVKNATFDLATLEFRTKE